MEESKKLYKVTLRGTYSSLYVNYNINYTIATDPTEAYKKVREYFDEKDIGYERQRELDSVELIAENVYDTDAKHLLII